MSRLLFRWLAIPWIQAELDAWRLRFNQTPRRADKNKILPQGIPHLISAKPHLYHSRDFKVHFPRNSKSIFQLLEQVGVSTELFDEMEQKWAPRDLPVFQLVPPPFEKQVNVLYTSLGKPAVHFQTFWNVYDQLLTAFRALPQAVPLTEALGDTDQDVEEEVPLISGLRDLRYGDAAVGELGYVYYGGLDNPSVFTEGDQEEAEDLREYADFSD